MAATDQDGDILWQEECRAYGQLKVNTLSKDLSKYSVGYTGHQEDAESGLTYARSIYYKAQDFTGLAIKSTFEKFNMIGNSVSLFDKIISSTEFKIAPNSDIKYLKKQRIKYDRLIMDEFIRLSAGHIEPPKIMTEGIILWPFNFDKVTGLAGYLREEDLREC